MYIERPRLMMLSASKRFFLGNRKSLLPSETVSHCHSEAVAEGSDFGNLRRIRDSSLALRMTFLRVRPLLAFLFGLLFLNCAQAENIKIGLPSTTITAMPFFVARDHGFFQQEGLTGEIVVMPASLNVKVLLAGEIQYVATIGSAVAAAIRGINVRTIMLFVDRPLQDLVGAHGVNAIADVKGKLLALSSRGGLQDIIMRRILAQSKIDLNQVTLITIAGQTAMIASLKTGRIAAALLNPPYNFLAYREGS